MSKLPTHRVILDGKETFFYDEEVYETFKEKNKLEELEADIHAVDTDENGSVNGHADQRPRRGRR